MNKKSFIILISIIQYICIQAQNIDLESLPNVDEYIVVKSNPGADTVVIGLHGGPIDNLALGDFEYFESIPSFSVVELMQYQHINSEVLHDPSITLNEAVAMNDTTVALIRKAVRHFNELDKIVVLIGHSFGGFLLHEYLDDYGISDGNIAISLAARFDLNQIIVDYLLLGHQFEFDEDGITVDIDGIPPDEEKTKVTFIASLAQNRYVDSLQMLDLSKLMVVYGMLDQSVGRLLPEEIEMLNNTNAKVLEIEDGSHNDPLWNTKSLDAIITFIRTCQIINSNKSINEHLVPKVYPTLTNGELTVETDSNLELKIIDVSGSIQFQKNLHSGLNKLNLSRLVNGYYIALLRNVNNEFTTHKILYKKH